VVGTVAFMAVGQHGQPYLRPPPTPSPVVVGQFTRRDGQEDDGCVCV